MFKKLNKRRKTHTARKKLLRIHWIELCQTISLVKGELFIYYGVIVLVELFVLSNFFPDTMAIIVIGDCILVTFPPQEIFQHE